ncbi:MAG: hypothetical protein ACRCYU_21830 [Nocardioides sp.]
MPFDSYTPDQLTAFWTAVTGVCAVLTSVVAIQNVGASVAEDIQVTFDPPIEESMGQLAGFLSRRYARVIPTMGPGRRLTNIYGHLRGDGSSSFDEAVPVILTVTIAYKDSHGREYRDVYDLTTETLRNETTSSPSNTDEKGMQRRLVKALEAIARGVSNR